MSLLVVIIILLVWAVLGIKEKLTPPMPPIKDIDAHLRMLMQLDPKDRKKYLKRLRKRQ